MLDVLPESAIRGHGSPPRVLEGVTSKERDPVFRPGPRSALLPEPDTTKVNAGQVIMKRPVPGFPRMPSPILNPGLDLRQMIRLMAEIRRSAPTAAQLSPRAPRVARHPLTAPGRGGRSRAYWNHVTNA